MLEVPPPDWRRTSREVQLLVWLVLSLSWSPAGRRPPRLTSACGQPATPRGPRGSGRTGRRPAARRHGPMGDEGAAAGGLPAQRVAAGHGAQRGAGGRARRGAGDRGGHARHRHAHAAHNPPVRWIALKSWIYFSGRDHRKLHSIQTQTEPEHKPDVGLLCYSNLLGESCPCMFHRHLDPTCR